MGYLNWIKHFSNYFKRFTSVKYCPRQKNIYYPDIIYHGLGLPCAYMFIMAFYCDSKKSSSSSYRFSFCFPSRNKTIIGFFHKQLFGTFFRQSDWRFLMFSCGFRDKTENYRNNLFFKKAFTLAAHQLSLKIECNYGYIP